MTDIISDALREKFPGCSPVGIVQLALHLLEKIHTLRFATLNVQAYREWYAKRTPGYCAFERGIILIEPQPYENGDYRAYELDSLVTAAIPGKFITPLE